MKKAYEILYAVAVGAERRRRLLTPVGLLIFTGLLLAIIYGSFVTDSALGLPDLLPGAPGSLMGLALLAAGLPLWARCILVFRWARGTPVPFNPPASWLSQDHTRVCGTRWRSASSCRCLD